MGFRSRGVFAILIAMLFAVPVSAGPYVAGGTEWKPFTYADENGHLLGISVDVARRVVQLADIDATFITYPVNRLQSMLQKGEIDFNYADALQWNSPEDLHRYAFSKPYAVVQEHLYFLADNPSRDLPVDKLNALIIGTVRGYIYKTLDPAFASQRLSRLETSQDDALIKLLQSKRVDAIAMVDDVFDATLASNHLETRHFRQGAKLSEAPLVFKLQPEHAQWLPRINRAIQTLSNSGELDSIRRHYLPASRTVGCASSGEVC